MKNFFTSQQPETPWHSMTHYQRFESVIALLLTLLVMLIIVTATFRLFIGVTVDIVVNAMNPLDHGVFQKVFGEVMTVLIALEFNHTIQCVVTRQQSIIQTKIILLIALLAIARKVIVLNPHEISAESMLGLAAIMLAAGSIYWLLRERDDRLLPPQNR